MLGWYYNLSERKLNHAEIEMLFQLWCLENEVYPDSPTIKSTQCSHYIMYEFEICGERCSCFILKWEIISPKISK